MESGQRLDKAIVECNNDSEWKLPKNHPGRTWRAPVAAKPPGADASWLDMDEGERAALMPPHAGVPPGYMQEVEEGIDPNIVRAEGE